MTQRDCMCQGKKEEEDLTSIQDSVDASIQRLQDNTKKAWRKTDYKHQKQTDNTNINRTKNQKTKMVRKTTAWTFQATNKRNLT